MKRRTLLTGVATGTAVLAGCVASGIGDDGGNETATGDGDSGGNQSEDDGDGTPSDSGDGTPSDDGGAPTVGDSAIETVETNCASTDAGDATAARTDGTVTVDGTIGAPNPCHEAVLLDASVEDSRLTLRVDVESVGEACQQCIGTVEYAARLEVSNADDLGGATVQHVGGDDHVIDWLEPQDGAS